MGIRALRTKSLINNVSTKFPLTGLFNMSSSLLPLNAELSERSTRGCVVWQSIQADLIIISIRDVILKFSINGHPTWVININYIHTVHCHTNSDNSFNRKDIPVVWMRIISVYSGTKNTPMYQFRPAELFLSYFSFI